MRAWLSQFPTTSLAWLAIVRLGIGLAFLSGGLNKFGFAITGRASNWVADPAPLKGTIENILKTAPVDPLYRSFLEGVVLPNAATFSALVAIGEFLVGLSLVLGLLTRVGALGGAFLNLNYMLMRGLSANAGWIDHLFFLIEITILVTAAGYVLGLDGVVRARVPAWLRALMSPAPEAGEVAPPRREPRVQPA